MRYIKFDLTLKDIDTVSVPIYATITCCLIRLLALNVCEIYCSLL